MSMILRSLRNSSSRSRPRTFFVESSLPFSTAINNYPPSPAPSPPPPHPFSAFSPSSPSPSLAVALSPFSFVLRLTSSHSSLHSPLPAIRGWAPFSGPLFLSSPPWKLLQLATPLHFRRRRPAFPRHLLQVRSFPIERSLDASIRWREDKPKVEGDLSTVVAAEEKLLNLPNLISISRMVSGPLIAWMIIHEWYLPAFGALIVSGATDWLDGFLARKMGINSVFGSYLDPLADKVLIGCVALSMVENDLLHPGLVGLVVLRDVALVSGAIYKRASSLGWQWNNWSEFFNLDGSQRQKVEPLLISKVNTVFQLLLVASALLQPELGTEHTQTYITYLSWLVAATTVASWAGYGVLYLRRG